MQAHTAAAAAYAEPCMSFIHVMPRGSIEREREREREGRLPIACALHFFKTKAGLFDTLALRPCKRSLSALFARVCLFIRVLAPQLTANPSNIPSTFFNHVSQNHTAHNSILARSLSACSLASLSPSLPSTFVSLIAVCIFILCRRKQPYASGIDHAIHVCYSPATQARPSAMRQAIFSLTTAAVHAATPCDRGNWTRIFDSR